MEDESIRRERLQSLSKTVEINPDTLSVEKANGVTTGFDYIAYCSNQDNERRGEKQILSERENGTATGIDNVAYDSADKATQQYQTRL